MSEGDDLCYFCGAIIERVTVASDLQREWGDSTGIIPKHTKTLG